MFDVAALIQGISELADPSFLWLLPVGVLYGVVVGAIPGMTAALGIALVLPMTFHLSAIEAIVFLSAIFTGGTYGGTVTAILLNMPGSSASAATTLDGFPMTRRGQHNEAQGIALAASALGSLIACVGVILLLQPIARFTLMFGPVEMLMVGVFALTIVASFKGESLAKGIMAGCIGLLIGTVGVSWGREFRATFGSVYLIDGTPLIPVLIGLLAIPGLFLLSAERFVIHEETLRKPDFGKQWRGSLSVLGHKLLLLRSTMIGVVVGVLPAAGASVASLVSWNDARNSQKDNKLGEGDPRGVIASEAANNSSEMGSTAVMLALGIPGGGATAIMLGAFIFHGLIPGPRMLSDNLYLGYALFTSQFLQILLLPLAAMIVIMFSNRIVKLRNAILVPIILAVTMWGIFTTREAFFDIGLLIGFGVFGYVLNYFGYPVIAVLLGVILADILEPELVRSVATHGWENLPLVIVTRPISLCLLGLTLFSIYLALRRGWKTPRGVDAVE